MKVYIELIMDQLAVTQETAKSILEVMVNSELDFSECSIEEFDRAARQAFHDVVDGRV